MSEHKSEEVGKKIWDTLLYGKDDDPNPCEFHKESVSIHNDHWGCKIVVLYKDSFYEVVINPLNDLYNSKFGDDKKCECGHPYYRHFDTYDNMRAVGCKYCHCDTFKLGPVDETD